MQLVARQRNELQRAEFRRFISQFRAEQFIFLDESSKDDRTLQRKYARSLEGTRVARRANFTRGTRYSILGAVSIDGVKTAHTVVGAFDRANFEFAIEQFVVPIVGSFANGENCSIVVTR
ncbi:hypothetical protein QZH41_018861 [Actinostola sp. cb2023]|nr:hypothetical protein QZH41_018861 [Actinostola sp. cb2023]